MLPVVLIGLGATSALLGLVNRRPVPPAHRSPPPPPGDAIRSTALNRAVSVSKTTRWLPMIEQVRGGVPRWLFLGHIAVEADGNPRSSTADVDCGGHPCDERGLMQLMPAQSTGLGLNHDLMFDPYYSVSAGARMYERYEQQILRAYPFATDDDKWRAASFIFSVGSVAKKLLDTFPKGQPITWTAFDAHARRACSALKRCTMVTKWLGANRAVWELGHEIERRARAVT